MNAASRTQERMYTRFSLFARAEHLLIVISFTMLCLTGLPQKFFDAPGSAAIVALFGGIESIRIVHRVFAIIFVAESAVHVLRVAYLFFAGRPPLAMVPTLRDVQDFWLNMLYYVGKRPNPPDYGRFDYKQKFEYWGIVWGAALMIITGLIMMFPIQATAVLPGEFVPASRIAHGGEALMAFLVIVIWHMYNAHLSPHTFPFDPAIFTGTISEHRMEAEHPRELQRIRQREQSGQARRAPAAEGRE